MNNQMIESKFKRFISDDQPHTLFPMPLITDLFTNGVQLCDQHLAQCLNDSAPFLAAERVYAYKPHLHLRRTLLLDPIAQYCFYDLVYKNRDHFLDGIRPRMSFGFTFQNDDYRDQHKSYKGFKKEVRNAQKRYTYAAKFDISAYFNRIYHHDLVAFFQQKTGNQSHAEVFGRLLREPKSGTSMDCLAQGMAPTKVIGSAFLQNILESGLLESDHIVRFMDDIYIFDNQLNRVKRDFHTAQRLLGAFGLDVNPQKTRIGNVDILDPQKVLDDQRLNLLAVYYERVGYDEYDRSIEERPLTATETNYLRELFDSPEMVEEDASLLLAFLDDWSENPVKDTLDIIALHPALMKQIFIHWSNRDNRDILAEIIGKTINDSNVFPELGDYQLFWLGRLLELVDCSKTCAEYWFRLYRHRNSSITSRSILLQNINLSYGIRDEKHSIATSSASPWERWSSLYGLRTENSTCNQIAKYFKSDACSKLIAEFISNLPSPR